MNTNNEYILLQDFAKLLEEAGRGAINAAAYDTAWVARVSSDENPQTSAFPEALAWLSKHQHSDGSWGEGGLPERVLATLAAIIALTEKGQRSQDEQQVKKGLTFLWRMLPQLGNSNEILPIGFELLLGAIIDEGKSLNLNLPTWLTSYYEPYRLKKLELLSQIKQSKLRDTSAIFSLEFLAGKLEEPFENFTYTNGSVGVSPAATASVLKYVEEPKLKAGMLSYLKQAKIYDTVYSTSSAGWGNVTNFDIFEMVWILYNLNLAGQLNHPLLAGVVSKRLDDLARQWSATGLPFSSKFFDDADVTATGYAVLRASGREFDIAPLEGYWQQNHLVTYRYERDYSISANVHGLEAYKYASNNERVQQLLAFLDSARVGKPFWLDKWHVSPYYTTCHAVIATLDLTTDFADLVINWVLSTQGSRGGWGYEVETPEETAYALQILIYYAQTQGWTQHLRAKAQEGVEYLRSQYRPFVLEGEPLWIGKNRYAPYLVIRAAILSALLLAETHNL